MADYPTVHAARRWLGTHIEDSRRESLLFAAGYAGVALIAAVLAFWLLSAFLGVVFGLIGLSIFAIACVVLNIRLGEDPLISGSTSVARGGFSRGGMNMSLFDVLVAVFRIVIALLMAPLTAPREISQNLQKRARVAGMDTEAVAAVLAELVERRAGIPMDELTLKLGLADPLATRDQLADVRGVVFLDEPDRVTLTETVQHEILACGTDYSAQPQ
jgi:hypothetical protein